MSPLTLLGVGFVDLSVLCLSVSLQWEKLRPTDKIRVRQQSHHIQNVICADIDSVFIFLLDPSLGLSIEWEQLYNFCLHLPEKNFHLL